MLLAGIDTVSSRVTAPTVTRPAPSDLALLSHRVIFVMFMVLCREMCAERACRMGVRYSVGFVLVSTQLCGQLSYGIAMHAHSFVMFVSCCL